MSWQGSSLLPFRVLAHVQVVLVQLLFAWKSPLLSLVS